MSTDVKQPRKKSLVKSEKKEELKESVEPVPEVPASRLNHNSAMQQSVLNNVLPVSAAPKHEDKRRESVEVKHEVKAPQHEEPLIDLAPPVPQPLPEPPQNNNNNPQPAPSNRAKRKKGKKSPENAPRNDITQSVLMKDAFDTL